jgi:hypothetical protein
MASACGTTDRTTARPTVILLNEALPPSQLPRVREGERGGVSAEPNATLQAKVLLNHPELPNETP